MGGGGGVTIYIHMIKKLKGAPKPMRKGYVRAFSTILEAAEARVFEKPNI